MKILISRLSSLGDVVCTLPIAKAIKRHSPESEITWVVDRRFSGIVECCPDVDHVVAAKTSLGIKWVPRFSEKFDLAFDMQGLLKSALPVAFSKASKKVGYHWQREFAGLFSQAVHPDPTSLHIVDQYCDVVRAAGFEVDRAEFGLVPLPSDLESVTHKLKGAGVDRPFVVLNPGAAWVTKRWPSSSFGSLADKLDALGFDSVLIGGKGQIDQQVANEVISSASFPVANLAGQTSIRELVALISLAKAHVGGDTGSTHIAAALGVPAIGIYSITRPARSCPYGQIHRCAYSPDGLAKISAGDVFELAQSALQTASLP